MDARGPRAVGGAAEVKRGQGLVPVTEPEWRPSAECASGPCFLRFHMLTPGEEDVSGVHRAGVPSRAPGKAAPDECQAFRPLLPPLRSVLFRRAVDNDINRGCGCVP